MAKFFIKHKKSILIFTLIILTISLFSLRLITKSEEKLYEVRLDRPINTNLLAIMISDDGENYSEYKDSNTWPIDNYKYKEAKCINSSGALVEDVVSFKNGKITLKYNKSVYCTLFFDAPFTKGTGKDLAESNPQNLYPSTFSEDELKYRYVGKDSEVDNNYICFGYNNVDECSNEESDVLFRIIGIDEDGRMKIVKNTYVSNIGDKEEEPGLISWTYNPNNYDNDPEEIEFIWEENPTEGKETAYLYGLLNNDYLNELSTLWQNKIEKRNWYQGFVKETDIKEIDIGKNIMLKEKEIITTNPSKIGLPYLSDFYLSGNSYPIDMNDMPWLFDNDYTDNDGMTMESERWTLTRYGTYLSSHSAYEMHVWALLPYQFGTVPGDDFNEFGGNISDGYDELLAYPAFYLLPDTLIKSGRGTIENPYIIENN